MLSKKRATVQLWMHHFREVKTTLITLMRSIFFSPVTQDQADLEKLIKSEYVTENSGFVSGNTITIVTWNIFKGYYQDRINNSMSLLSESYEPDLWLLQEAPMYENSTALPLFAGVEGNRSYVSSHKFNGEHAYFPFSHSGQLTYSRFAYGQSEVKLLPQVTNYSSWARSTEFLHRMFLYTQIKTEDGKTIGVYNIHLENMTTPSGRSHQIDFILDSYKEKNDDYVIMAGDFNSFFTRRFERLFKKLHEHGFVNFAPKRLRLLPQVDFVYSKGFSSGKILTVRVSGSDHNPVVAHLEL